MEKRKTPKYNHILLYEEGSIDTDNHKEKLEAMGIYMLPYRKTEAGNSPELLDVFESGSEVSAIGFEIEPESDFED